VYVCFFFVCVCVNLKHAMWLVIYTWDPILVRMIYVMSLVLTQVMLILCSTLTAVFEPTLKVQLNICSL
jgi:hypothetical protein